MSTSRPASTTAGCWPCWPPRRSARRSSYTDSRVIVHCRIPQRALSHFHGDDTTIRPHGPPIGTARETATGTPAADGANGSIVPTALSQSSRLLATADATRLRPVSARGPRRRILRTWRSDRFAGMRGILTGASSGIGRRWPNLCCAAPDWCSWRGGADRLATLAERTARHPARWKCWPATLPTPTCAAGRRRAAERVRRTGPARE